MNIQKSSLLHLQGLVITLVFQDQRYNRGRIGVPVNFEYFFSACLDKMKKKSGDFIGVEDFLLGAEACFLAACQMDGRKWPSKNIFTKLSRDIGRVVAVAHLDIALIREINAYVDKQELSGEKKKRVWLRARSIKSMHRIEQRLAHERLMLSFFPSEFLR